MKIILKNLGKFLKSIDIYGQKVELNFQKQTSFKTVFGGVLTCFIFFLLGLGCWFFGKELIEKYKPSVISSQRSVSMPKRIDVKKDNLIIAFGIADGSSRVYKDPTIFSVRAVQETIGYYNDTAGKQVKKTIQNKIKLKSCTIDDIGIPSLLDYFKVLDLSQHYCFDDNQEVYMEGDFDAERFSLLYVYAEKCKNSTSSEIICQPLEVIDKKLAFSKLKISLSDNVVDPLNFENPFTYKGISFASQTSSSSPKEVQMTFVNQYIESDVGFLYGQIETKQTYMFSDMKEASYFNDPNVLVGLQLRVQKQRENLMQRRYQRFTDVLVQIGGLLKILTTLGGLLCYPFTKLYLFKSIVDQVFLFDCNEKVECSAQKEESKEEDKSPIYNLKNSDNSKKSKKKKQDQIHQKIDKQSNKSKNDQSNIKNNMETFIEQSNFGNKLLETNQNQKDAKTELFNFTTKKKDQLIEKTKDYFQSQHKIIKYTFINIFSHIFLPNIKHIRQQRELVEKGISKVAGHLDVFYILNKLLEVDKIKSILLNQDQLKLFEYIPKPVISIEKQINDIDQSHMSKSKHYDDSINNFIINEKNQKTSTSKNEIKQQTLNNVQQVYSLYKKEKSDQQKAFDAIQGLSNILNQNKLTKIDESLINIIDPIIIKRYQKINKEEEFKNDELSLFNSYFEEKNNILRLSLVSEQSDVVQREKAKSFNSNTNFVKRINEIKQQKRNYGILSLSSRKSNNIDQKEDQICEYELSQTSKDLDQSSPQNKKFKPRKSLSQQNIDKGILENKNGFTVEKQDFDKQTCSFDDQSQYFVIPENNEEKTNKIYLFQDMISQNQNNNSLPIQTQSSQANQKQSVTDNQQRSNRIAHSQSENQKIVK